MTTGSVARRPAPGSWVRFPRSGWASVALGAAALAALITVSAAPPHAESVAAARALIAGVPIAVGLYVRARGIHPRFGVALAAVGGVCLVATLGESRNEVVYTIGRVAGWVVELLLVYVVLSFPTGRLTTRTDRLLVVAMGLVIVLAFVPRLVLAERLDVPTTFTSCVTGCPTNPLFALAQEPAFVGAVLRPTGALLVLVIGLAVLWRLSGRLRSATPLGRRILAAVLAVGAARTLFVGVGLTARLEDPGSRAVEVTAWCLALAIPVLALVFLLSLVRWRLFAERALERLAEQLRRATSPEDVRESFVAAFGDRRIELALPAGTAGDAWLSSLGSPIDPSRLDDGREASEISQDGVVLAVLVHDPALREAPGLVEAGLHMAAVTLDNQRLAAAASSATREIERSRARIAASADRERRRIERDLHDGAQQRLVALRIELELAEELIRTHPDSAVSRLHELEAQIDEAIDELRSLTQGVYPSLLADRGLPEALGAVAARCPVRARVDALGVGRYPPEVENAVYFCVLEALQNVAKHAAGAERVTIQLDGRAGSRLQLTVRDDGCGFSADDGRRGAGLTNMADRLAAVGGRLEIVSAHGAGTTVRGEVPLGQSPP